MAHLQYQGKEVFTMQKPNTTFTIHVFENGNVLRTTGPRGGKAKVLRISETGVYSYTVGRYAKWSDEVKQHLEKVGYRPL